MITSDFLFGVVTGCLCTLVVVAGVSARLLSPFVKEAIKRSKDK